MKRYLAHDHALALLPLFPTVQELARERSALRVSAAALREERDQRQHRPWILRLFDRRLPSVLQQITDIESRWEELSTERRGLQAAVLQAQAAAEAADNASRAVALEVREQAIQQAIEAALAHQPVDPPPPQELARAAPAPATPEPPRLRRSH